MVDGTGVAFVGRFIQVLAFIRDHFNNAYRKSAPDSLFGKAGDKIAAITAGGVKRDAPPLREGGAGRCASLGEGITECDQSQLTVVLALTALNLRGWMTQVVVSYSSHAGLGTKSELRMEMETVTRK